MIRIESNIIAVVLNISPTLTKATKVDRENKLIKSKLSLYALNVCTTERDAITENIELNRKILLNRKIIKYIG